MKRIHSIGLVACLATLGASFAAFAAPAEPAAANAASSPTSRPGRAAWAIAALGGKCKPMVEAIPGGEIDWTNGIVYATGTGKLRSRSSQDVLMAERAARLDALRNGLLLLGGIRSGPGGQFQNVKDAKIDLDAVVKDFEEAGSDYDISTQTIISKMKLPLYGPRGVIRLTGAKMVVAGKTRPLAVAGGSPVPLVIDARGSGFRPCVFPRVMDDSGQCIELPTGGAALVSNRPAAAVYLQTDAELPLTPAEPDKSSQRLVFKAQKCSDKDAGSLVLSEADAATLCAFRQTVSLSEALVVLVDPPRAEEVKTPTGK